ncbi:MAG: DedA family protein [Nitrospirae bacterium]|nr:DedA family protein [Nitrospirota bacterium]
MINGIIEHHPYIGLFSLLILGGIGVPFFPEDATFILCGFLMQGKIVKPVPALLVIYTGVLIADFLIYLFGRKYCRAAVCHRWFQRILPPERLAWLEKSFKKKGIFFILFGRHFIGIRAQIFLVSGIMRMHPVKFLLADAFTVIFTIAVMVTVGYVGGHSLQDIGIDTSKITYVVIVLFASFSAGYLAIKYFRKKRQRQKGGPDDLERQGLA